MSIDKETRNLIRRLFYGQHFTINAICESQRVHRDTVKRAICADTFHKKTPGQGVSLWADHDQQIREVLGQYPKLAATRLLQILRDSGAEDGSIDSLRRHLRKIRPQVREAFLKRMPLAAEEGQVDWGHFGTLQVGGATRKLYCFVMTLSWSRYTYARFTFDMKTETFLSCHVDAFKFFDGVPRVLLYDNLKSAVIERQGNAVRFNPMMLDFSGHYNFEPRACSPYRGNEKGRVERKIRFIRENFFAARELGDIDTLNGELWQWLDDTANLCPWPDNKGKRISEKYRQEQPKLIPLPLHHPLLEVTKIVRAGKYAHIKFDLNTYSIPMDFVQRSLVVRASHKKVRIYADIDLIAEHERSWDREQEIFNPGHRSELIARKKKGAFGAMRSELLQDFPELATIFESLAERGEPLRQAVNRLSELRRIHGDTPFKEAISEASRRQSPSPESIALILLREEMNKNRPADITPNLSKDHRVSDLQVTSHSLDSYDHI